MTVIEQVISGALLSMFSALLASVLTGRRKVSSAEFTAHKDSSNPHISCPVHTVKLENIERMLLRIDKRVYQLIGGKGEITDD